MVGNDASTTIAAMIHRSIERISGSRFERYVDCRLERGGGLSVGLHANLHGRPTDVSVMPYTTGQGALSDASPGCNEGLQTSAATRGIMRAPPGFRFAPSGLADHRNLPRLSIRRHADRRN